MEPEATMASPTDSNTLPDDMETDLTADLDIVWTLFGAYLIFLMQCGFAMLEAGTVRKRNTVNILLKNLLDSCVAALVWWAIGYPVAFGKGNDNLKSVIGGSNFFMAYDKSSTDPGFYSHWVFQWAFAATSATIVSGAAAERCRYQAYVIYTIVITGFIYPVVVHWVWSDWGWLSAHREDSAFQGSLGLLDFAGSSVVHVTGGGAAFFVAWFLGPRAGRFDATGKPVDIRSNNQSLIMLGTFLLWFGWYAFNSASGTCVKGCMITASLAAVNTTLSAATAAVTVLFVHVAQGNRIQIAPGLNGLLSGLVGITAGCALVEPFAACLIGACSGLAYYGTSRALLALQVDDPLEASAVHFSSGFIGTVAVGLFATETNIGRAYEFFKPGNMDHGLFYGGAGRQLCIQLLGALVIAFFTCSVNFALFCFLASKGKLRVARAEEISGLNASLHGIPEKEPRAARREVELGACATNSDDKSTERTHA